MNVLTVGQKIKKIREDLSLPYHRVTQAELAGNGVTKSAINKLENGKMKINNHLANVIIKNAQLAASKWKIEFNKNYTVNWLMEDREQEIFDIIIKYIAELNMYPANQKFQKIKKEIDFLCENENIEDKLLFTVYNVYVRYYEKEDLYIAKSYLLKMYEIANKSLDIGRQLYVIKWITYIYSLLERWEDIITWGNRATTLSREKYLKYPMKCICFNMAMAYKSVCKFKECNGLLETLKFKYVLNHQEEFDINILKADCLKELKEYNLSEKILKELLQESKISNDSYRRALVYANMAKLKYRMNDLSAVGFIKKSISIQMPEKLIFRYKETEFNCDALKIYIEFGQSFEDINNVFQTICKITLLTKEYDLQFKSIILMINYSISKNNSILVKNLLHKLKSLKINAGKKSLAYFKVLSYLYANKDKDFEKELLKGFNLIKQVEI